MTIPSEFDLIAIERRADELDVIAVRLYKIAEREYAQGDAEGIPYSYLAAEFAAEKYRKSAQTSKQADAVRALASDVVLLLGLVRSMKSGGRVSSVR